MLELFLPKHVFYYSETFTEKIASITVFAPKSYNYTNKMSHLSLRCTKDSLKLVRSIFTLKIYSWMQVNSQEMEKNDHPTSPIRSVVIILRFLVKQSLRKFSVTTFKLEKSLHKRSKIFSPASLKKYEKLVSYCYLF